ncbi:hypothetical protein FS837_002808 [Tulasnella sp. UAMH 9824]|nr:hypothetical protein FS837_002808 [Tulasnella sp. UAMH 9824]
MLGGINVIPKPGTVPLLADGTTPTIVLGADVRHPGPGITNRPSYAAVVGSVDSDASKYDAITRPQQCRREMIDDLTDMVAHVIKKYMQYRKEVEKRVDLAPQRILFYRDGISEVEYDFYLQSHSGALGTNRSAHYNVLVDQNNLMPNDLQTISLALCHIYARSTCSVSVVAPVYYAKIAGEMAGQHYDPDGGHYSSQTASASQSDAGSDVVTYEDLRFAFESIHGHIGQHMYFQ